MRYKTPSGWTIIDHETLGLWDSSIIAMTGVCYISDQEVKQGHLNGTTELTLESLIDRSATWKFNVKEQISLGRTTSKSAIAFWQDQPEHVRQSVIKESAEDVSILELFNLLQAYHIEQGTTLDQVRLMDRKNFDIAKIQHLYTVTMGKEKDQARIQLPYNPYVTWECSQLFKLFTGDNYANISPDNVTSERFIYHHAGCDAALDAYRFLTTFAGSTQF